MKRVAALSISLVVLAFISFAPLTSGGAPDRGTAHARPALLHGHDASIADITERALPSVVNVSSTKVVAASSSPFFFDPFFGEPHRRKPQYGHSLGSGVIVSEHGYVLTNNHVVSKAKDIKVSLSNGREFDAVIVGADPKSDLAVLKLQGKIHGLKAIPFGNSSKLRLGDVVLAIGNPFGVGQTVTMGIVSAKGRANMGIVDYEDFIQTDAAINPGNSGGALINMDGELVGINTAILSRTGGYQGIGFAIPSNMAEPIMGSLIKRGKVVRGWLGVAPQDINDDLVTALRLPTRQGVLISDVVANSPAARAGLKRGDVVVEVGDKKTDSAARLRNAIAAAGADAVVPLKLYRDGSLKTIRVKLGELPDNDVQVSTGSSADDNLGIRVSPVSRKLKRKFDLPDDLNQGVVITSVDPSSAAAALGLRPGDVILEVNRKPVKNLGQLRRSLKTSKRQVALLIYRDGATMYLAITK